MSEPENFLSRWSRRKLEGEHDADVAQQRPEDPTATPSPAADAAPEQSDETAEPKPDEPAFDVTKLPSLESITSETDIRLFLQKGVPAHLTRAALRRAWTADPAIRDFKEMAENQYDFATGSDLPGFGSLDASADDIRKMVANVFGDGPKTLVEQQATPPPESETPVKAGSPEVARPSAEPAPSEAIAAAPQDQQRPVSARAEPVKDVVHRNKVTVAAQQSNTEVEYDPMPLRRPHGRALPQ
jgi:uncharacterized protein DUF3306